MFACLDSSVPLRLVPGEPGRLGEWPRLAGGVTNAVSRPTGAAFVDGMVWFKYVQAG